MRDAHGTLVLTLGEQGAQLGGERVPAFPGDGRRHDRCGRRVHARRSRSRSPRGSPTSRPCAGAAPPARTWSSIRASIPGLPTARSSKLDGDVSHDRAPDRRHRHGRRRRHVAADRAAAPERAARGDHDLQRQRRLRPAGRERALHRRAGRQGACRSTRAARSRSSPSGSTPRTSTARTGWATRSSRRRRSGPSPSTRSTSSCAGSTRRPAS